MEAVKSDVKKSLSLETNDDGTNDGTNYGTNDGTNNNTAIIISEFESISGSMESEGAAFEASLEASKSLLETQLSDLQTDIEFLLPPHPFLEDKPHPFDPPVRQAEWLRQKELLDRAPPPLEAALEATRRQRKCGEAALNGLHNELSSFLKMLERTQGRLEEAGKMERTRHTLTLTLTLTLIGGGSNGEIKAHGENHGVEEGAQEAIE